jgi:hypothetical protein
MFTIIVFQSDIHLLYTNFNIILIIYNLKLYCLDTILNINYSNMMYISKRTVPFYISIYDIRWYCPIVSYCYYMILY